VVSQIHEIFACMKTKVLFLALALCSVSAALQGQVVAVNGVDLDPDPVNTIVARDGYGGLYDVNGELYWWMCVEPNGSAAAGPGDAFIADALSVMDGWTAQNTERSDFYSANPGYYSSVITPQTRIIEYVLDSYLPWSLAGASGRFLEQDGTAANFGSDNQFYNSFFAVQNFISEMYGKPVKTLAEFTDMSDFNFFAGNSSDPTAIFNRQTIFDTIVADVESKAGGSFFDNYVAEGGYQILATTYSVNDPNNWQDALVILSPVPEPSGALLIACTGLAVMLRRFRRLAA